MSQIQRRVFVSGKVQGVGFRASTVSEAVRLGGLNGFVRNLEDGRVEAVIAGDAPKVLALVAWCKHGPSRARVEKIEVIEEALEPGLGSFATEIG